MSKIHYAKGYNYQLRLDYMQQTPLRPPVAVEHEFFRLTTDGVLWMKEKYAWDGATDAPDTKAFLRGSLLHDGCYQMMREGLLPQSFRQQADDLLIACCREDGMVEIEVGLVYEALKLFGGPAAALGAKPYPTLEAP